MTDGGQILWHRLRANHLAERLGARSLAAAAYAGLQDSAPWAALVALHARVEGVGADDWEDSSLVQTWAPRGAVFVVARADLGVFARGILPRAAEPRRALEQLAARARASVAETRLKGKEEDRLGAVPQALATHWRRRPVWRLAFAVAGVQIRWDARQTWLLPSPQLELDDEQARRELTRRFLRSLGPAGPARFSRWAAVSEADARETFHAIRHELATVTWQGGDGYVLAEDAEALAAARPVAGVRFLPFGGDPVLQPGEDLLLADRGHRRQALPPWASGGLVLLDGEVAAAWGRAGGCVSLLALAALGGGRRERIELEAQSMPVPRGDTRVSWRTP